MARINPYNEGMSASLLIPAAVEPAQPLVEELTPLPDAWEVARRLAGQPHLLFLDSAATDTALGRYSFVTADPFACLRARDHEIIPKLSGTAGATDPFAALGDVLAGYRAATLPGLPPFQGGAAGLFAYDLAHHLERLPRARCDDFKLPDLVVGFYDWVLALDHHQCRAWLISTGFPETDPRRRRQRAARRLRQVRAWLQSTPRLAKPRSVATLSPKDLSPQYVVPGRPTLTSNFDEQGYLAAARRAIEYIHAGDCFQVNLAQRLLSAQLIPTLELFGRLRQCNPAPFSALFDPGDGLVIASASPERFLKVENREVEARPIKGTRPRCITPAVDAAQRRELLASAKDRAENVMIVDLLRNDLGRLCNFGSVTVEELFAVERYPTLWQMTSTITGALRADVGYHDIFRALFPCGSVTGAPKVRAMQLLAQLEAAPRSVYTGAIGFFAREQTVFNVAIRTLQLDEENASMGVGSGIVIDSNASDEYRECLLKAEFLNNTTESFSLIETMKWQGEYSLLDLHLDRLEDSAAYFDFPCDRKEIKSILLQTAMNFPNRAPRKVRLLLDEAERIHIEHEILPPLTEEASPAQVCIANQRTDARDRFLCHKTTNRPVYAEAIKAAAAAGFADVLFLNHEGQVTEGAISNIFIEKDSRWFTPPVVCGLLNGIYRRHLLATRPEIQEKILSIDDMKTATAIYLTNAVRGLRQVTIDWNHKL
jgi:aminodeoxychorismate synthase component I